MISVRKHIYNFPWVNMVHLLLLEPLVAPNTAFSFGDVNASNFHVSVLVLHYIQEKLWSQWDPQFKQKIHTTIVFKCDKAFPDLIVKLYVLSVIRKHTFYNFDETVSNNSNILTTLIEVLTTCLFPKKYWPYLHLSDWKGSHQIKKMWWSTIKYQFLPPPLTELFLKSKKIRKLYLLMYSQIFKSTPAFQLCFYCGRSEI